MGYNRWEAREDLRSETLLVEKFKVGKFKVEQVASLKLENSKLY
jgi:hypothetical protein